MKQKIVSALKTKYSNLGFSDKAFNGVADFLAKTIKEESEIDNAISGVEDLLKTFQGESDKLRSEKKQLEDKVKELETSDTSDDEEGDNKPEPSKDKGKDKGKDKKTPQSDDVPAWAKKMVETNTKLLEKVTALEQKELQQTQAQSLTKKLTDKKVDIESRVVKMLTKGKTFKDDVEMDAFVEEVFTAVGEKQDKPNNSLFNIPTPGGGSKTNNGAVSAEFQQYLDSKKPKEQTATATATK